MTASSAPVQSPAPGFARQAEPAGLADAVARLQELLDLHLAVLPSGTVPPAQAAALTGGKYVRARALIAVAHAYGDPDPRFLAEAAAAVELLHTASLVHDDFIDGSSMRRGAAALHTVSGDDTAILVGDLLIGIAQEVVAPLGSAASAPLARALRALSTGQLLEPALGWGADAPRALERYATLKTGALFGAAFELGGAAAAAGTAVGAAPDPAALAAAGERLGLAFQVADDLLDVHGDVAELGKDHGADLRNGIPTLPLWLAFRRLAGPTGLGAAAGAEAADPAAVAADRLAAAAGAPEVTAEAEARIAELFVEGRALLPPALRPQLLDLAAGIVVPGAAFEPATSRQLHQ
ncbi:polyprenyl synthetase family protein [Leucobacter chironomi]|uniref:polyprenyl synthetase family protein n=1 Tax=Leucobacter chironomi TaxID=491918 RepID=UPI000428EC4D|nr:polyprenyl synthetase family protein [Leucobacter chironomi]